MIKILIVEDQVLLCDTLAQSLNGQGDMEVVGITDDASEAPELCRKLNPDLVLMDVVTKNNNNGITFAAQIRKELPEIKIVIITALPEITFIDESKKAGVHSYIYKKYDSSQLFYVIRNTMQGINTFLGPKDIPPFANQFTEREIAVIRFVCQGKTRKEMLEELGIANITLKSVITSILNKTGFDTIMEFAVYAAGKDLISTIDFKPANT